MITWLLSWFGHLLKFSFTRFNIAIYYTHCTKILKATVDLLVICVNVCIGST